MSFPINIEFIKGVEGAIDKARNLKAFTKNAKERASRKNFNASDLINILDSFKEYRSLLVDLQTGMRLTGSSPGTLDGDLTTLIETVSAIINWPSVGISKNGNYLEVFLIDSDSNIIPRKFTTEELSGFVSCLDNVITELS